jgi:hypothetical protein
MINNEGSISIESVFDSLLRLGLVMQLVVLTVSITLTILISFLINIGYGAVLSKAALVYPAIGIPAVANALLSGKQEAEMTNATQGWLQDAMKWKP